MKKHEKPASQGVADKVQEEEHRRRTRFLLLFSASTSVILSGIGIKVLLNGMLGYGLALLTASAVTLFALVQYHLLKRRVLFENITVFAMSALILLLVATGGEKGTAALWSYIYPLLITYVIGLRRGIIYCTLMYIALFTIVLVPEVLGLQSPYSDEFKLRYLLSYLFTTLFSFVIESSRQASSDELLRLGKDIETASRMDVLTGLANRRHMQSLLDEAEYDYGRSETDYAVLMVDVDHFKKVNDRYGHSAGDVALQSLASIFANGLRQTDTASRWGGEEFLVLLRSSSASDALQIAERIRAETEQLEIPCDTDVAADEDDTTATDNVIRLTVSVGVALRHQGKSLDATLLTADNCLYQAKHAGRNRVCPQAFE
ncbi:diguanylate cyclase [Allohahella marinimesophila]|uniref:diguanylate cyclase n=1 Tax=Allohahella marinimesophila TaxID=1054972 RepID=A0ABP7PVA8_9GAMM